MNKKIKGRTRMAIVGACALLYNLPLGACADISLNDAISLALINNTGLKITQKGEDTASSTLSKARGNNGVTVGVSDSLGTSKDNDSDRRDSNSLGVSASLPIYSGGANEADIKSAEYGLQAAKLKTERERENLKLNVIQAYYDALEARRTVDVRRETVDKYQEHYNNVNQLYQAGSKARIDVIRSSVELSDARQNLIKAENSYEVDLAKLRNYLNINRVEPLTLTTDFSYENFAIDMNSCIDYAYRNRKDLLIDEYTLKQKAENIKVAKAGKLPSLKVNLGLNQDNNFNPTSSNTHGASASVGLSWNIFDSGKTQAEIDSAQTEYDVAQLNVLKDKEDIDLSVREAYYNMREAEKRFNSTKDAVGQAEEDYYIAREKYRAGEGLMLDIIDAQEALSTAKLNYISAQYDYARYKAGVENAMGIGLNDSEQQAARLIVTDVDRTVAESPVNSTVSRIDPSEPFDEAFSQDAAVESELAGK